MLNLSKLVANILLKSWGPAYWAHCPLAYDFHFGYCFIMAEGCGRRWLYGWHMCGYLCGRRMRGLLCCGRSICCRHGCGRLGGGDGWLCCISCWRRRFDIDCGCRRLCCRRKCCDSFQIGLRSRQVQQN